MSVLDASAVAQLLLRLPLGAGAETHVFDAAEGAVAPDLLNAEVLHVIRTHERAGRIDPERSREAMDVLLALPIARYPTFSLLERAWTLRHDFTAYDAMYVALAEALDTALVTADGQLASAAATHTSVQVVLLE